MVGNLVAEAAARCVPNRTICRQASRRYPVVIVCAVTTWRDREPQEQGQRPDRGAGSAAHASLFSSCICFVSHSPGAFFAGLMTGLGLHAAANG